MNKRSEPANGCYMFRNSYNQIPNPYTAEQVREILHRFVDRITLGRLFCNTCQSWDDECGCTPDRITVERQKLHKIAEERLKG